MFTDTLGNSDICVTVYHCLFQFSAKVLELARKQRMNTDIRKNIFCIIMTSEDYLDAFEKLLRSIKTFYFLFFFFLLLIGSFCGILFPSLNLRYSLTQWSCSLCVCVFSPDWV